MIWKICFVMAIFFAMAGVVVYLVRMNHGESRLQYLGAGVFLASVTMCFPVMHMQENAGISLAMCISHSIRMFVIDTGAEDILGMLTADELGVMLLPYKILASALYLLAPVFTLGVVLQYFSNTFERLRLSMKRRNDLYVFSELNARSLEIATDMWQYAAKDGRRLEIVFCCSSKSDGENMDLEKSARSLNAVLLPEEAVHLHLRSDRRGVNYFMISDQDDANVEQTLQLIDDMTGGSEWYTPRRLQQKNVTIRCYAANAEAEILLDAKDKQELRVILEDEVRDAVYEQLLEYPLYTNLRQPANQQQSDQNTLERKPLTLLIAGCGKAGREFLKAAVWCGQMVHYDLTIHVIDRQGDEIRERLREECPELLSDDGYYKIHIHECDMFGSSGLRLLTEVGPVDYCMTALGDDEDSIRAAVLMRRHYSAGHAQPFICAYVRSAAKKAAVSELFENTRNRTRMSYRIVPFGCGGIYYGNESDAAFVLEYLGLGVQSHYFRLNRDSDEESRGAAIRNFYEKQGNRRSSIANGMHINTKLWEMGYGILRVPKTEAELVRYRKWIRPVDFAEIFDKCSEEERAACYNMEHERWMAYVRTEGWSLASNGGTSIEDIRACYESYCEDFKNQNYLARLHPALVPIKSADPETATLQQVDDMIVQVNRERGLGEYHPDYVQSDVELVDHIGEIVSGAWCGPEGIRIAGTMAHEGECVICSLEDLQKYYSE